MKKVVSEYLHCLTLEAAQHCRNMAVFPLISDRESTADYLLLDEALDADLVVVTEVDEGGTVPELKVENKSDRNLLILDGEELVGAKQNRVVNVTILIAAHAIFTIPVSCVEQGRWSYQSHRFMSKERVMPSSMRMRKSVAVHKSLLNYGGFAADQGEIWDMISKKKERFATPSATFALGDIYDHEEDAIDEYTKHFEAKEKQAGILVMINDQVIGCDCFGKHDTLVKTFSKLIKSYVLDAIDAYSGKEKDAFSREKASAFVDDVRNCLTKERSSVSLGTDVRLTSHKVIGSALAKDNELLHLTAFLKDEKENEKKTRFFERARRRNRY